MEALRRVRVLQPVETSDRSRRLRRCVALFGLLCVVLVGHKRTLPIDLLVAERVLHVRVNRQLQVLRRDRYRAGTDRQNEFVNLKRNARKVFVKVRSTEGFWVFGNEVFGNAEQSQRRATLLTLLF